MPYSAKAQRMEDRVVTIFNSLFLLRLLSLAPSFVEGAFYFAKKGG